MIIADILIVSASIIGLYLIYRSIERNYELRKQLKQLQDEKNNNRDLPSDNINKHQQFNMGNNNGTSKRPQLVTWMRKHNVSVLHTSQDEAIIKAIENKKQTPCK